MKKEAGWHPAHGNVAARLVARRLGRRRVLRLCRTFGQGAPVPFEQPFQMRLAFLLGQPEKYLRQLSAFIRVSIGPS